MTPRMWMADAWELAVAIGGGIVLVFGVVALVLAVAILLDWARDQVLRMTFAWKLITDFIFKRKGLYRDREELGRVRAIAAMQLEYIRELEGKLKRMTDAAYGVGRESEGCERCETAAEASDRKRGGSRPD